MYNTLNFKKSISSQAASISACITFLDCAIMVAAFIFDRYGPANKSAAFRKIAALCSQAIWLHFTLASIAASIACCTSFEPP